MHLTRTRWNTPGPRRRSRVVRRTALAPAVALAAGLPLAASPSPAGADVANAVVAWNEVAGEAAMASCLAPTNNPLDESRMYAMTQLAVHDALNAIDQRSTPYAFAPAPDPAASPAAAVAAAAHAVLTHAIQNLPDIIPLECRTEGVALVDAAYATAMAAIPDGIAKTAGVALGQAAATAIIDLRSGDGSGTPRLVFDYPQGDEPGEYRFTPGTPLVFTPGWGDVTPFVLRDSAQFGARQPYQVNSEPYRRDFDEVKALGGDGVNTPSARNHEQTEMALFWVESSPLAWNRIARGLATSHDLDEWEAARLFGLLNIALADGYIGSFETKYEQNFWRPVTAIHLADDDGNPGTEADPTWTPLVQTPPIPDHDSAHAVEGAAAAEVFRRYFGTDRVSFQACSFTLPDGEQCDDAQPTWRSFDRLSDAAAENGESRILVGFHFRHAVEDGLQHGERIARHAVNHYLQPAP